MSINSKSKGSKNERNLCKWFTDWSEYEFNRVPASGGLRWKKKDDITGDIICTDPRHSRRFPYSIEAKSYKDINFEHIIIGVKNIKVIQFWEQAKEDAKRASMKIPLLFMRYNGMPAKTWFVVMTYNYFKLACKYGLDKMGNSMFIIELVGGETIVVINSEDLKRTNYRELTTQVKRNLRNGKKV